MTVVSFAHRDVATPTTHHVKQRLGEGKGCVVFGPAGSGKSYAVAAAVNGAIWVDLAEGPFQQTRFFVDVARQTERGEELLAVVAAGEPKAARELAAKLTRGRYLVVDRAERLMETPGWSWDEPAEALWQPEQCEFAVWLRSQLEVSPTVLVGRHLPGGPDEASIRHYSPGEPPLRPERPGDELRDTWHRLVRVVGERPAGLVLARAALPFVGLEALTALIAELDHSGAAADPLVAFRLLAAVLRDRAPLSWHRVLTVAHALDGGERSVIESVISEEDRPALQALRRNGLLRERDGRVKILPALIDSGGLGRLNEDERRDLLFKTANRLRTAVNDLRSLTPEDADRVYRAHELFVQVGDFDNARQTARLHVAGLVDLARRTSLGAEWERARQQYEAIRNLLATLGEPKTESARHTLAYVLHYRAYNGELSKTLAPDEVLTGYQDALKHWPKNALWHQRVIETLIRAARERDALQAVETAYGQVDDHARRHNFLRVRPARVAMNSGAPVTSLRLIEPILNDIPWDSDPEGASNLEDLLSRWAAGVQVHELPHASGALFFKRSTRVELQHLDDGWRARFLSFASKPGRADGPVSAVTDLATKLVQELQVLLAPAHTLDDERVRRKSALIARVDTLNSDLGIEHSTHRWLLGRIEGNHFVPVQRDDLEPIPFQGVAAVSSDGLYIAKVPVFRDGAPSGGIDELVPAGSGRSLEELVADLVKHSAGS